VRRGWVDPLMSVSARLSYNQRSIIGAIPSQLIGVWAAKGSHSLGGGGGVNLLMARAAPANIRSLARAHTELALRTLSGIALSSKNDSARVAAATELLNRGWGRPKADSEGGEQINITVRRMFEADVTLVEQRPSDREVLTIEARPDDEAQPG
jgi:hypothetical protein